MLSFMDVFLGPKVSLSPKSNATWNSHQKRRFSQLESAIVLASLSFGAQNVAAGIAMADGGSLQLDNISEHFIPTTNRTTHEIGGG